MKLIQLTQFLGVELDDGIYFPQKITFDPEIAGFFLLPAD